MSSLETYGFSEDVLKVVISLAIAIIPAALVLIAALRAGQGVANAARGFARAIYGQIDEPAEQQALAKLLHTNPGLIDDLSHLVELMAKVKDAPTVAADGSWQAVATLDYTPPEVTSLKMVQSNGPFAINATPPQEVNVGDTAK